ncbi:MAG: hypothetical protein LC659_09425 [Myxococcales bacterium]|nr:hypothetical protein [Myxococcales bacterium]
MTTGNAAISGRLVRSSLRYLRDREGAATVAAVARELPQHAFLHAPRVDDGWIALAAWLEVLAAFEKRFGDPPTLRLLREMTRATMAAAVSTVWGTFLAAATPDQLMARVGDFWAVSFDTGRLGVVERAHGRAKLAVDGWPDPPREVGAIVAEACAVFLARVGVGAPRVVATVVSGRLEIDGAW